MKLADLFHSVATGPEHRRRLLTPIGLLFGLTWLLLPVLAALATDRWLGLPPLLPGPAGLVFGGLLVVSGVALWGWCFALFRTARGTPIPFNPPRGLVATGPYAWVRHPMLAGAFAALLGLGFLLHSSSMVVLWTPLFVLANAVELKLVEEPELERRFGASYTEYRHRVPMFLPRPRRPAA